MFCKFEIKTYFNFHNYNIILNLLSSTWPQKNLKKTFFSIRSPAVQVVLQEILIWTNLSMKHNETELRNLEMSH